MQNQYVGDIGDFGKYGLLKALSGGPLRLGVVWYLFPNESEKPDGKFIGYLKNPTTNDQRLSECDIELYRELHKIVIEKNDRRVVSIQQSGILPSNTLYYDQSLSYLPDDDREARRAQWLEGALAETANADLVFVDPDNGITEKPIQLRKNGPKYVFMEDLWQFRERGQSLIIYHHLGRRGKAPEQINFWAKRLQKDLKLEQLPWALWYHRGTARAYFIVPHEDHRDELTKRVKALKQSLWYNQGHFELVKSANG